MLTNVPMTMVDANTSARTQEVLTSVCVIQATTCRLTGRVVQQHLLLRPLLRPLLCPLLRPLLQYVVDS